MVMPKHICPYGLKSKDLLKRKGFEVEDHPLTTREQTEAFMKKEGVKTTPQTYIDGQRIGGYEELEVYLKVKKPKEQRSETSYQAVVAIFGMVIWMLVKLSL